MNMIATNNQPFNADLTLKNFDAFTKLAKTFMESDALPKTIKNEAQLVMILQAGADLGMTITASMQSLAFIHGRVTIYWEKVIELVKSQGYKISLDEDFSYTDEKTDSGIVRTYKGYCKAIIKDKEGDIWEETFTIDEARDQWLLDKDNWKTYPKLMLRYRAIRNAVKFFCPEVLGGIPMYEEIKDRGGEKNTKEKTTNSSFELIDEEGGLYTDMDGSTVEDDLLDGFGTSDNIVQGEEVKNTAVENIEVEDIIDEDTEVEDQKPKEYIVWARVKHPLFKEGTIQEVREGLAIVLFDNNPNFRKLETSSLTLL